MSGWIKLHRKFVDWEWYDDINTKVLFLHCLLKANHDDKNYRGTLVPRGSFLTGYELLSAQTGLSLRQIRTSLNKLKTTNEVTVKSSKSGSHIFINNYSLYQSKEDCETKNDIQSDKIATNKRQDSDKIATSNKNDKNIKNDKNKYIDINSEIKESVEGFIKMRKTIKRPMTDNAIKRMIKKLETLSSDPAIQNKILNQSEDNNWTDIWPLKENNNGSVRENNSKYCGDGKKESRKDRLRRAAGGGKNSES